MHPFHQICCAHGLCSEETVNLVRTRPAPKVRRSKDSSEAMADAGEDSTTKKGDKSGDGAEVVTMETDQEKDAEDRNNNEKDEGLQMTFSKSYQQ